jgi:hypothetical protein
MIRSIGSPNQTFVEQRRHLPIERPNCLGASARPS